MTNPLDQPKHRLSVALIGFHRAFDRLSAHPDDTDIDDVMVTVTEALWWARNVDEGCDEAVGSPPYRQDRAADYNGEHMVGLRFARNRAGHERALMISQSEGFGFPLEFPLRFSNIVWRPVSELAQWAQPDPAGEAAYVKRLEGKPVAATVTAAAHWFATAQTKWSTQMGIGTVVAATSS